MNEGAPKSCFSSSCKRVYAMIPQLLVMFFVSGCSVFHSLSLWTPRCSHTNQPTCEFTNFDDGHHFLFSKDSKLLASVSTKSGYLQGKFEIYYETGILKYWGKLDMRGHVVSGKYNTGRYSNKLSNHDVRTMTVADAQNAQAELYDIMQNGISKTDVTQIKPDGMMSEELLINCSQPTYHPPVGNIYRHDGKCLKVFQSIGDAVLVAVDILSADSRNRLDMRIDTNTPYVDGELLKSGRYEYVGPYTYETLTKQMRTIRRFRQVK